MKKALVIIAVLALPWMQAFAAGRVGFGLQATGANLKVQGDLKDVYAFGFGGGAHLDIKFPPVLAIRIQGDFIAFSPDNAKYQALLVVAATKLGYQTGPSDFSIDGGRINIISFNANTKFSPLPLRVTSPYLTAGVGLTNMYTSHATIKYTGPHPISFASVNEPNTGTKLSANLGAGVDLHLLVLKLYLEARYTWIFAEGSTTSYIPVSLGITF